MKNLRNLKLGGVERSQVIPESSERTAPTFARGPTLAPEPPFISDHRGSISTARA